MGSPAWPVRSAIYRTWAAGLLSRLSSKCLSPAGSSLSSKSTGYAPSARSFGFPGLSWGRVSLRPCGLERPRGYKSSSHGYHSRSPLCVAPMRDHERSHDVQRYIQHILWYHKRRQARAVLLEGDLEAAIRDLKARLVGEIAVSGPDLARSLTEHQSTPPTFDARLRSSYHCPTRGLG